MDWTKWCEVGSNVGSIVTGLGVVVGGVWGLFVYFRRKREAAVIAFRQELDTAVHEFSNLATSFQNQVVAILEEVFQTGNPDASRLVVIAEQALAKGTLDEVKAALKASSMPIHESLLFSISGRTHGLADAVSLHYESTIAPLAAFSPWLHLLFTETGQLVLAPYKRELSVLRMDDYAAEAVVAIWLMRRDDKLKLDTTDDVRFHLRSAMAQFMAAYGPKTSLTDLISKVLNVVGRVAQEYRQETDRALWAHHRKDRRVRAARLDRDTYPGTIKAILEWKFAEKSSARKDCMAALAELEGLINEEDK
jgi:hypothetical protein